MAYSSGAMWACSCGQANLLHHSYCSWCSSHHSTHFVAWIDKPKQKGKPRGGSRPASRIPKSRAMDKEPPQQAWERQARLKKAVHDATESLSAFRDTEVGKQVLEAFASVSVEDPPPPKPVPDAQEKFARRIRSVKDKLEHWESKERKLESKLDSAKT